MWLRLGVRGGWWGAQADGPAGGGRGALFTPVVRGRSGAGFREQDVWTAQAHGYALLRIL